MRYANFLSASILLCGATVAQIAGQSDPYHHQHTLESSTSDSKPNPLPGFRGFQLWSEHSKLDSKTLAKLSPACRTSMTQPIHCHAKTRSLQRQYGRRMRGLGLGNDALSDLVCDSRCGESLAAWLKGVDRDCKTLEERMLFPTRRGGQLWAGWNETCLRDDMTGRYCGDIIDAFSTPFIKEMPAKELCSFCHVELHRKMQSSPYSLYDRNYKANLEYINSACNLTLPTAIPTLTLFENPHIEWERYCTTFLLYTAAGDTCTSIATQLNVSSAAVLATSWPPIDCFAIPEGTRLCIPFGCKTYTLKDGDTCESIERELSLEPSWRGPSAIREYNPWVNEDCSNLHEASDALYGRVICVGPTGLSILDE
ncbi:hypothetical protein BJX62DRAFT_228185 [Aspergillus germanicus]